MRQDQRADFSFGDQLRGDDRFAESRGCRKNADVVFQHLFCDRYLLISQVPLECNVDAPSRTGMIHMVVIIEN